MSNNKDLEPLRYFNKFRALEESESLDSVPTTSQFFYPLDAAYYLEVIRSGGSGLISTEIWPSGHCNHHCVFCSSDMYIPQTGGMLDAELLMTLISGLSSLGNRVIRFSGGGEPLLVRGIERVIEAIDQKGMYCVLVSNGSLISETLSSCLAEHASVVRVSFNAGTEHDYFAVHRVDHFSKVVANMRKLSLRREAEPNNRRVLLGATFVVVPQNYGHIAEATRIVKECGFDFMLIRGLNPIRYRFLDAERMVLLDQLRIAHSHKDEHFFVSGSITKLDGNREKKAIYPKCYALRNRLYLDSHGEAYPCFSAIMNDGSSLGNVLNSDIERIWNGTLRLDLGKQLAAGRLPGYCSKFCDNIEYNTFFGWVNGKVSTNGQTKFRRVPRQWARDVVDEDFCAWM